MSDTATVPETPPTEAFTLRESAVHLVEGVQDDGSVLLHIIRPGLGRGRGNHLYEADMLRENAGKFGGWRMYINHLAPEARKAQGGLPRDVRDLGGRILESWWDESIPASDRFGAGAVVAKARPTPFIRELIESDPEIIEASISATATGVRAGERGGKRVWVVEGIEDKGSVDWVTEAGAGGRIVPLMESVYEEDADGHKALLASMTDEEFADHLRATRPELLEALADPGAVTDDGTGEPESPAEEDDMPEITPAVLREAFEESPGLLVEAVESSEVLQEALVGEIAERIEERLEPLVAGALERERDLIRAEARADADRRVDLRDMRDEAHRMISESRLPDEWKVDLRREFDLVDGNPTPGLDQLPDIDDDGEVSKKAAVKLAEAVETRINRQRELYAAANPTKVRGQGPSAEDGEGEPGKASLKGTKAEALLQEAGFEDPEKVYDDGKALA